MDVGVPLKRPFGEIGPYKGHSGLYGNMDAGWFMLVFLLSLVSGWRTVQTSTCRLLPYPLLRVPNLMVVDCQDQNRLPKQRNMVGAYRYCSEPKDHINNIRISDSGSEDQLRGIPEIMVGNPFPI